MAAIVIPKGLISLAGLLHKPLSPTEKSAALVVVHPGGGVKEQTASLYAKKLAAKGFVTVCYDASYQGESGGQPHFLEDPNARVSDVWAVVDYLQTQDFVDPDKIGIVGICAGGGYAVAASKADYRLKALATVSMVNIGDSARFGWDGNEDPKKHVNSLKFAGAQMSLEVTEHAERAAAEYVPANPDDKTPFDLKEACDYYLTPRAQHPRAANKMLLDSLPRVMNFDAFHLADLYLSQPTLMIVGEKAGSRWHTEKLNELIGGATKKVVVPEGTHMDFYDKLEYVDPAVNDIAEFMGQHVQA